MKHPLKKIVLFQILHEFSYILNKTVKLLNSSYAPPPYFFFKQMILEIFYLVNIIVMELQCVKNLEDHSMHYYDKYISLKMKLIIKKNLSISLKYIEQL